MRENAVVLLGLLVGEDEGLEQHEVAVRLAHGVVLLAGDVIVIGEAHRDIILILPDIEAVLRRVVRPARHLRVGPVRAAEAVAGGHWVKQPAAGGQAAQAVDVGLRAGGDVALHADGGVKLHDRAGHDAVEGLDRRDLPEHGLVVHAVEDVDAAVRGVGQRDVLPAVEAIGDDVLVGVVALRLAEGDEEERVDDGDEGGGPDGVPQEFPLAAAHPLEHDGQQQKAQQRDGHIAPEARRVVLEAEGERLLAVGVRRFLPHQADGQGDAQGDAHRPAQGAGPVGARAVHGQHGGQAHHQGEHVVPAGVVARVEELERGVEDRHQGHEEEQRQEALEPVLCAPLQKADDARHAEQRQPRAQGGPLGLAVRGEVGARGDVGREEEALQNVNVALVPAVEQGAPAVRGVVHARVLHHSQDRRHQQDARHQHAHDGLTEQQQEVAQIEAEAAREKAQEEVDQREGDLAHEEVVVDKAAEENGDGEDAAPPRGHILVERPEHEREEDDRLVEMIEEDVVDGEAGEGVEQAAEHGRVPAGDVAAQIVRARRGRAGELEDQKRPHQIRHGLAREGKRQPEKRAAEQIEGVASDEIRAEVRRPAPAQIAAAHRVVAHLVERHLLHVEVAVKEKIAVVEQDERDKKQKRNGKGQPEGAEQIAAAPAGEEPPAQLLELDRFSRHVKNLRGGRAAWQYNMEMKE